jgi:hypothetical protein
MSAKKHIRTVFGLAAVGALALGLAACSSADTGDDGGEAGKSGDKAAAKKPDETKVDTANAASDLLRKYMRRPK